MLFPEKWETDCFSADEAVLGGDRFIYEWAGKQADLSMAYKKHGAGVSASARGKRRKAEMMTALDEAIIQRGSPGLKDKWFRTLRPVFESNLEDPGTLENFRFFHVPESDEMLRFYLDIWSGRVGEAMLYLHGYGKDLSGQYRWAPPDEAWVRMIGLEAIALNEREKARAVANTMNSLKMKRVCFFGGGYLPERLYANCFKGVKVTCFETGEVNVAEIMKHPSQAAPRSLKVVNESLMNAENHLEMKAMFDMVVMHGVSMYLGKTSLKPLANALMNAAFLLRPGGVMSFDLLLMTQGMMRTATAQHWPEASEMRIYQDTEDALEDGKKVVAMANSMMKPLGYGEFKIEAGWVNSSETWGDVSVRFVLSLF